MKKYIFGFVVLAAFFCVCIILNIAKYEVYTTETLQTKNATAILLGTGKFLKNGRINQYYRSRVDTAVELYKLGKIKTILISGDNSKLDYNEPFDIKEDLLKSGVQESDIILDYAGFRTLDSIRRSKNLFNISSPVIISQPYHCKRALYLCEKIGIENATACGIIPNVKTTYRLRNNSREMLAWIKAWIDVNLLNKKAKFEK